MSVIVLVVAFQILLFRSRWGLRTRAVGEHPKAAETVGIDVIRLRYRNGLEKPVLARPGEIYAITIDAGVTSNVFLAGHRIRIEIASSAAFFAPGVPIASVATGTPAGI